MLGLIMTPRHVHVLIPGTYEYVILHQRVIKVADRIIGRLPWIIWMDPI